MQPTQQSECKAEGKVLAVALELSSGSWKLGLQDGRRAKPALYTVRAEQACGRLSEAVGVIEQVKKKWLLGQAVRVVVVYEAGQEGFWIERALCQLGYEVLVVDAASIPVSRQARRAKTDRLDTLGLLMNLRAWLNGERDRLRVVHSPGIEAEGQRQWVRERGQLQKELQQHRDRIGKLLRTQGCWQAVDKGFAERLKSGRVRAHDGAPLPRELRERLERECERAELVQRQWGALEQSLVEQLPQAQRARVGQLMQLKAIGAVGAVRLVLELFWRKFDNRRQVGSCVGLVPQPYDSGQSRIDQGISKQGNARVRSLLIELAWLWLRYQPGSALARWFRQRTQANGANKRARRIAIVAVARRLAIALWRYLTQGVLPEGALLKA